VNLALDIGNTHIKAGLFCKDQAVDFARWPLGQWTEVLSYARQNDVQQAVLAAVVPVEEPFTRQLSRQLSLWLELTDQTPLPFTNAYQTPHTLGRDRLAAVAGAHALWPNQNCLVIDCGTCIKYDLLTAEGIYLGGNISPGASMRLTALHTLTAQLPLVPLEMPADPVGRSTTTALQNGALRGAAIEIEGFIQLFRRQFSPLHIVLTGGDATFFRAAIPIDLPVEPHLTLYGLNHLLLFYTNTYHQPG
jgi:type III pantothenate kinase